MLDQERWVLSGALREFAADGEFDLIREIIDVFLSDTQEKVEALQKAAGEQDLSGAQRIAHSLKGAARQMGLSRLGDGAECLERSPAELEPVTFGFLVLAIVERWREARQLVMEARDSLP